uniref:Flavin-containing amine oxidase n=1 Tax=Pithovirus LCPAC401 TaxID=2506595 RepID=A0A481ZB91_9VIRU|nr:MAG: flavin-containing amine oxidase [Pithovirus LCPAC401]
MKIAILGGGLAGLSVAHNLTKCDFNNITIYERNSSTGGMARSKRLNGMKQVSEKELPFNYSWRIVGKEYLNFRDILREIPIDNGNVEDLLVDVSKHWFIINKEIIKMDVSISTILKFYGRLKTLCFTDLINISRAYLYSLITCNERIDTHDDQTWDSFIGPLSKDAHMMLIESCGPVFGIDYHKVNATSMLSTLNGVSFFIPNHNQVLNTTWDEGLFKPWEKYLKGLGVEIRLNTNIEKIEIKDDKIIGITIDDESEEYQEEIIADIYFICLPVESAYDLLRNSKMGDSLRHLKDNSKQLMTNLTVYFEERIYMEGEKSCIYLPETPWKVIIQPCGEIWKDDIKTKYGVGDVWFVGICCQHCEGTLYGKKFSECSIKESTEEVLYQMYSHGLDKFLTTESGKKFSKVRILNSKMWESFHDDLKGRIYTTEPKFSNNVDTLKYSPPPECPEINNAYFATSYCKISRKIFLMDGAFEASAIACNTFFDEIKSDVERVKVHKTKARFCTLEGLRIVDRMMFKKRLPPLSKYVHPFFIIILYFIIIGTMIFKVFSF